MRDLVELCKKERAIKPPWVEDEEDRVFTGYQDIVELLEDTGPDVKKVSDSTAWRRRRTLCDCNESELRCPQSQEQHSGDFSVPSYVISTVRKRALCNHHGVVNCGYVSTGLWTKMCSLCERGPNTKTHIFYDGQNNLWPKELRALCI